MKVLSLFANIGVAEAFLADIGVNVVVANELVPRRAKLYSQIYPHTEMICGDITQGEIFQEIIEKSISNNVDTILATPPCQGISRAGKQEKNDIRNLLIVPVVKAIIQLSPKYVIIENVPQFLDTEIVVEDKKEKIITYLQKQLGSDYYFDTNVIDTKNYSVPQTRQRTIILLSRKDQAVRWVMPTADEQLISLQKAIGDLPSLDPWISDIPEQDVFSIFPDFKEKTQKARQISIWHTPPSHVLRQVITMQHTPSGKTAFDNKKYIPLKFDGTPVRGYKSTYRRLRWEDPASTVTMDNRKISSQNNVHPGHYIGVDKNGDAVYSDPRALTLFELMRIMSLPDDWPLPIDANPVFVRSIIGEGIPPLFIKKVFENCLRGQEKK